MCRTQGLHRWKDELEREREREIEMMGDDRSAKWKK